MCDERRRRRGLKVKMMGSEGHSHSVYDMDDSDSDNDMEDFIKRDLYRRMRYSRRQLYGVILREPSTAIPCKSRTLITTSKSVTMANQATTFCPTSPYMFHILCKPVGVQLFSM